MLPRLHHVTRLFRQPPRHQLQRSFTTTSRHLKLPVAEARVDSYIVSSLYAMNVGPPSQMPRNSLNLPRTTDPDGLVTARFAPGQHVVKAQDKAVLAALVQARSVQRLAHYRRRAAERPLWLDWLVHQAGCSPVVVTMAKRRMRLAIRTALGARGVHKYGWKREALEKAWFANRAALRGKGKGLATEAELEVLRVEARVPVLTGTIWVTIKRPKVLVLAPFAQLRQIADHLVGEMVERHKGVTRTLEKRRNAGTGETEGTTIDDKARKPRKSRRSKSKDLEGEFGDLGHTLTKDDFF
ncbi:hypothetical protein ACHAQA_002257 [Verticillium albo-atrum]